MASRKPPARYQPVNSVEVHLWGVHMGSVALDPTYGYYAFAYTPGFRRLGIEPAPLHMPAGSADPFLFTDLPEATYKRLPALLSDALPDDFGNALIDRYMADRGIAPSAITALDRLAYMGERAMGALGFKPARGPVRHKPTAIALNSLVDEARKAVAGDLDRCARPSTAGPALPRPPAWRRRRSPPSAPSCGRSSGAGLRDAAGSA
ncbi:HipA N-terminal domain-containing protein [Derxia lacustris]|uniref:HipA N-terminal domain-containing protein n=1 Tax=Derxia lacustris TaxID=764842 RepID=UPI000A173D04|nr:HipA N-terminal domain-containing protein [Derxia lacustris]